MENLKPIDGIPNYYINDIGEIYSTKISYRYNPNGDLRLVKPRNHPSGYLYYGLFVGKGKSKVRYWRRAHRLVWESHNGKIPQGFEINHINNIKTDNRLTNLELVTRSENMIKAFQHRKNKEDKL